MLWELGNPLLPDNPNLIPDDDPELPECPLCGSNTYEYLFYRGDECRGCDICLDRKDVDQILEMIKEGIGL